MSPFPREMAKSFVRGWQGSSSVGWSGSGSARVQRTLQPWRETPTKPQEIVISKGIKVKIVGCRR